MALRACGSTLHHIPAAQTLTFSLRAKSPFHVALLRPLAPILISEKRSGRASVPDHSPKEGSPLRPIFLRRFT